MVEKRSAFSEMAALKKEVDKLFEQLVQFERIGPSAELGEWFPSVDVFEDRGHLVVKVEAPGMGKNDLSVVFRGHKLVISGEKKPPRKDRSVNGFLCLERSFGKFRRTIHIDEAVALNKARAELAGGVLTITMPRLKDRRGTEIRLDIEDKD